MLVLEIEACKPPRNDLKVVSIIEMTFPCDTRYSFVLLRPKSEVKLSTQRADKWICMGKWLAPSGGDFIHELAVIGFVPEIFE